ncbi:response regulator transcription factor [Caballeronia sordidicola]|uniref:Two-component response regulator n=1 Tax=Caballeronia sordidicola TaxID=196367 RepID=A0A242MXM8_CABSO|nr:response regulator transcription factor [Caballeronia sordidicola]OTP76145.1 two-component response regulator [Caballeronia sordidicola]
MAEKTNAPRRILVVEDDLGTAADIARTLHEHAFEADLVTTGGEALRKALAGGYDAMTLDRMLPDADGIMVVRLLRENAVDLPVLMISALSDIDEKVRGLRAGGDDYLTKPYHPDELVVRLEVMIRRKDSAQAASNTTLKVGTLEVDLIRQVVRRSGTVIELSQAEYRLLVYMMEQSHSVLSRPMIFEAVWGYRFDPGTNLIEVHIGRLRKKIDIEGEEPLFHTIRNKGYRLGA